MSESTPAKPASTVLLALALLAYSGAHLLNNTLLASAPVRGALDRLQVASGGWVEPVLVRSLVVLGAFLVVVLWIGRRPAADVGWRSELVLPGFLTWLVAWLALQASLVAAQLVNGQTIVWHTRWTMLGAGGVLGGALAQALGHALAEDTAFRGFYLPELRARFARLGSGATLLALAGAALLFGLAHLPTRYLVKGSSGMDLLGEQWGFFSAGLALGVACLATRNLFAVVALHVLWNDPAPWIQVPGPLLHDAKICVCAGVIVLAWLGNRRQGHPLERRGPDFAPPPGAALPSSVSRGSAGPNPLPLAGRPATPAAPVAPAAPVPAAPVPAAPVPAAPVPAAPVPAAPKTPAAPAAPAAHVRDKK